MHVTSKHQTVGNSRSRFLLNRRDAEAHPAKGSLFYQYDRMAVPFENRQDKIKMIGSMF
jgi:hypothetical protein